MNAYLGLVPRLRASGDKSWSGHINRASRLPMHGCTSGTTTMRWKPQRCGQIQDCSYPAALRNHEEDAA